MEEREKLKGSILWCRVFGILLLLASFPVGSQWQVVNPSWPVMNEPNDVLFDGEQFVAVGGPVYLENQPYEARKDRATILTSQDGWNWVPRLSAADGPLNAIAHDGSLYVAVGDQGTVVTSRDAVHWEKRKVMNPSNGGDYQGQFVSIAEGGGRFVAVSRSHAFVSENGMEWNGHVIDHTFDIDAIAYGNGRFLAIGEKGSQTPVYSSTDGMGWHYSASLPISYKHCNLTFGNGLFVVTCSDGSIFTSTAGDHWKQQSSPVTTALRDVAWGEGRFLAVGYKGNLITSVDGTAWGSERSGVGNDLKAVAAGGGRMVVLGSGHTVVVSEDGMNWMARNQHSVLMNAVVYAGGQYVSVGSAPLGGSSHIFTSPDGMVWTQRVSSISQRLNGVAYGQGLYVAVGDAGTILSSSDGITWRKRDYPPGGLSRLWDVTFAAGRFVAVGDGGHVVTSTDGITWQKVDSGTTYQLGAVSYGNGRFVAVGAAAGGGVPVYSDNGLDWSSGNNTGCNLSGMVFDGNDFLAVGTWGNACVARSTDGVNWTKSNPGLDERLYDVTHANGRYVVVGQNGLIATSEDGVSWTPRESWTTGFLSGVTHGPDGFLAVGQSGPVIMSPDGEEWQQVYPEPGEGLKDILHDGERFVAVGEKGTLMNSIDGAQWTRSLVGAETLHAIILHADVGYLAAGAAGTLLWSDDLVNWETRTTGVSQDLYDLIRGGGLYLLVGEGGTLLTSVDGASWDEQFSRTSNDLLAAAYGDGLFMVVGKGGIVRTSEDGMAWQVKGAPGDGGEDLHSVVHDGQRFLVGGEGGLYASPDGDDWTLVETGLGPLRSLLVEGTLRMAAGGTEESANGAMIRSQAALGGWIPEPTPATPVLNALAYGGGKLVAVGERGVILRSEIVVHSVCLQGSDPLVIDSSTSDFGGYESYVAEAPIETQGTVRLQPGSDILFKVLRTGSPPPVPLSITLDREFSVAAGAVFHARIEEGHCP